MQGFTELANFVLDGKGRILKYDNHRFHRNSQNGKDVYWKCALYKRYGCKARLITRTINGYEMLKIKNPIHSHASGFAIEN